MTWLKLDWDYIPEATMAERVVKIFIDFNMVPKVYKTEHGYHIYVFCLANEEQLFTLRRKYWDDWRRIKLDLERRRRGQPYDVLFQEKAGVPRKYLEPKHLLNIIESHGH